MNQLNAFDARKSATKFVIVWGFYTNSDLLRREEFTCRKACWARVQELMKLSGVAYDGGPRKQLALLEVYVTVPGTHGFSVKFFPSTKPEFTGPEGMAGWGRQAPFISSGVYCG